MHGYHIISFICTVIKVFYDKSLQWLRVELFATQCRMLIMEIKDESERAGRQEGGREGGREGGGELSGKS